MASETETEINLVFPTPIQVSEIADADALNAKLLSESREQALDRMLVEAESLGANAVISVQFETSVIMGGAAEMMAYGTGVVVEEDES